MQLSRARRIFGLALGLAVLCGPMSVAPAIAQATDPALAALVDGPQRSDRNRVRDPYRHPAEVLSFFGIRPDSVVVEILPGAGGYWTEILAPYLRDKGRYVATIGDEASTSAEVQKDNAGVKAKLAATPSIYDRVELTPFEGDRFAIATPGSADFVLTFRNIHNWMADGTADAAFRTFYAALKPGGILGVEEHRGRPDQPQDPAAKSGYVREDHAIALAEKAGFQLLGRSEVNANPRDTKDYSVGVWALPPSFRLKDQDRERYAAIGESDRFVLTFVKPKP
jgi:predicted methyltransferase